LRKINSTIPPTVQQTVASQGKSQAIVITGHGKPMAKLVPVIDQGDGILFLR
jgi:hypothetical protein